MQLKKFQMHLRRDVDYGTNISNLLSTVFTSPKHQLIPEPHQIHSPLVVRERQVYNINSHFMLLLSQ